MNDLRISMFRVCEYVDKCIFCNIAVNYVLYSMKMARDLTYCS